MENCKILIIGTDVIFSKSISDKIKSFSKLEIELFNNHEDALANTTVDSSIAIVNTAELDISELSYLKKIKNINPKIDVIIVSKNSDTDNAVQLMKEGAFDYFVNDNKVEESILNSVKNIIKIYKSNSEYTKFKNMIIDKYNFNKLIGESLEIQKVYNSLKKIMNTNINVSLHGEPGTGKEMIAKVIHYNSQRKHMPFITIDLRAIKYDARDKELLGVDKSIREDNNNKTGLLERANGGTVFIEGFEDINDRFQFYLQKILQNKEIVRVGGIESIPLDVRIITSYNHSLPDLISQEKIKELQYFRTMGVPINIPPLRERGSDIIILARKFVNNFISSNNMEPVTINLDAQEKILSHPYTGNVQELKAVIELATVMCNNNIITDDDISFNSANSISDFLLDEKTLKEYTRGIIKHFLTKYDNNVLLVAEKLDVGKSTIYRMIKNNEI